jgi:argininosuccinate synthase
MGVFLFTHMHKQTNGGNGPLVVLAYSGGLDTSAIVPWLRETYNARVLCFAADVGQGGGELKGLVEKAKRSGADDCVVEDLREEFVRDFVFPTLRAGAVYARTYLLGTSMARPLTAARQVALAQRVGAQALAHGCTGKGNDQVRFELTYAALGPDLQVIAPWREWKFQGREDLIAYVHAKGVPVQATAEKPYSTDRNLWHCSHEGGILEDPSQEAPEHIFVMTKSPLDAPAEPVVVTIGFEEGTPVSVDHVPLGPVELLETLNEVAGEHGVGRADVVEDRLVGMKSRGVYETPGGTVLYAAHRELEQMVLDRRTLRLKDEVALRYADLVYDGRWWTPEREALDALVTATQKHVTGTVRLKLYKGSITVAGRESPHALYQPSYATFGKDNVYNQKDAEGFIRLYGLASRIAAGLNAERTDVPTV